MEQYAFIQAAILGYRETLLWQATDDDGEPLGRRFGFDDTGRVVNGRGMPVSVDWSESNEDVHGFIVEVWQDVFDLDPAQVAHDFVLTRNRHGAGFWDRGLGDKGDRLTKAAHVYGEQNLYVGNDGKLYVA